MVLFFIKKRNKGTKDQDEHMQHNERKNFIRIGYETLYFFSKNEVEISIWLLLVARRLEH